MAVTTWRQKFRGVRVVLGTGSPLFRLCFALFYIQYMIRVALPFCLSLGWCCFPSSVKAPCKCPHRQSHTPGVAPQVSWTWLKRQARLTIKIAFLPAWFLSSAFLPFLVSSIHLCLELASLFFWSSFSPLYFPTLWKNYLCINSPVWLLSSTHFWDVLCVIASCVL